jgi:hypothetical protein
MNNYQLFNIEAWELAKPKGIEYTHVYYTKKSGEVRKVKGTITVMKSVFLNGERKNVPQTKNIRWDGFGKCYVGTHNIRKRIYDIPLKS